MGATTVWERWDSMLPDGSINPGQMTSFNHYALGAVADWMHRVIGGIAPLEPGYSSVLVAPRPGGGLTWARSSLQTRHGVVSVSWEQADSGAVSLDVEVPDGGHGRGAGAGRHCRGTRRRRPAPLRLGRGRVSTGRPADGLVITIQRGG